MWGCPSGRVKGLGYRVDGKCKGCGLEFRTAGISTAAVPECTQVSLWAASLASAAYRRGELRSQQHMYYSLNSLKGVM